jgi:hypothetical protein
MKTIIIKSKQPNLWRHAHTNLRNNQRFAAVLCGYNKLRLFYCFHCNNDNIWRHDKRFRI